MLDLTLQNLAKLLGARYQGLTNVFPLGVAIDSRAVKKGDLFFALEGERVDGHLFVDQAFAKGAVGAVVARTHGIPAVDSKNLLICGDPLQFLQNLAKLVRQNMNIPVIAVTGSTGKTTTKDLIYSILQEELKTLKTAGNYNNEIGVPLTLCGLEKSHAALVVEMGMRGLGQIDFLCELARPTHGVITNIGMVHAELLGSQEKIAQAKGELLRHIPSQGAAFLNIGAKELLQPWIEGCKGEIFWYGLDEKADVYGTNLLRDSQGGISFQVHWQGESHPIKLNLPGEHNVENALAAIAVARSLKISWAAIQKGLAGAELTGMRLEIETNSQGVKIINDTYNANPTSMAAAVKVLGESSGKRKIAVLGDMYELGVYVEEGHKRIGQILLAEGIDLLVAVGELGRLIGTGALEAGMPEEKVIFAKTNEDALKSLGNKLAEGDIVLVKGSRGMKMEGIVNQLMG